MTSTGVVCDNEVGEEERRRSWKGRKSLSRVRQMEATETRLSVKVKLRRKTRGQVWQVVSLQEKMRSPQRQVGGKINIQLAHSYIRLQFN